MPTTTVYFRGGSGGTQIVETELPPPTSSPAFTKPLLPVKPSTGIVFAGSPAATGDRGYDMGQHVVIARSESGHIYQVDSNQETSLKP